MNKPRKYIFNLLTGLLFIFLFAKPSFAQTSSSPVCDSLTATINGLNVSLFVAAHSPVSNPISHFYFSFGDNTGEQGTSVNNSSHQYSSSGHYDAYAFVIDDTGLASTHCTTSYDLLSPTPTPTPTPAPTPIPTITPTPIPANKPTCFVNAYSYGMNVTATISTLHSVGVIYYYFNFNDGGGDRNFTSRTMTHLYTKEGTYTTTAYARDNQGQSDRCNSDPYVIAAIPVTPTPTPCCAVTATTSRSSRDNRDRDNRGHVVTVVKNAQAKSDAKELPKTGLPLGAWALAGLVPAGIGLRKFKSISPKGNIARFLWEKRKFLKD